MAPTTSTRNEGVSAAAKSDQIWPVLLLNTGVGIFYVGPFMAILPLVVRAGGEVEELTAGGPALGFFEDAAFQAGEVRLDELVGAYAALLRGGEWRGPAA